MQVIVCGAGQVGFNIARQLTSEANDVTVIDTDANRVRRVTESIDVKGLVGFAAHPPVLQEAGAEDADMLIAVTYADEVNMIACQVAHSLFNVPTKIARVRHQSYLEPAWRNMFSRDHLPIDVIISPEIEVARAIIRRLEVPGALDVIPMADDSVRAIAVRCMPDCPVLDTPLQELTELFPDLKIFVVGIIRDDELIVPTPKTEMREGDEVYFVADRDHVRRAISAFGHEEAEARRIIIIGGGNIGVYIAHELEESHPDIRCKLIELNEPRARAAADQLSRTTVLLGDALDREILEEANVAQTETVVAVSNDDEVNILSSLLAKRLGADWAITLVNSNSYGPLVGQLGVDAVVNPRGSTVSTILQHVRRGRIRGVYSVREGAGEFIEAEALETSSITGKSIRDIRLPKGILIGSVIRKGEVIVPRGDTQILAHDRVVLFTNADLIKKVEKLFSVGLEFF
ncbi:MAG: Trk system potassium transporter TrkA [Rhodospirillaceae bacterium]|nr:Trk system potassium transporter TrkA [Rhodospirillaceae bacterium]